MAICDNMKAIRKRKGMTQKQVADACGLAGSTIRTYELGNANPKPATVAKIAKALGVSPAELYGVEWMPSDPEANSALYQSLLSGGDGTVPIDDPSKTRLLAAYDRLNADGQMEAIKRTEELAQIPAYQATPAGFSADEEEKLQFMCHRIQNARLELDLMAKKGVTSGIAVDSSHRLIAGAKEEIASIMLEHFARLVPEHGDA